MKLYFYRLNYPLNKGINIDFEMCESEEKTKSFNVIGEGSSFLYRKRIMKSEIGKMICAWEGYVVVLCANDTKEAVRIFKSGLDSLIEAQEEMIELTQKKINEYNTALNMLDDWMLSHETERGESN